MHAGTVLVLVIGLLITASFAVGTRLLRNDNEDRLLQQRINEVATVASSSIGSTHAPLSAAAALAETTNGDTASFKRLMAPMTAARVPYVSASLWSTTSPEAGPLVVAGVAPKLARQSPERIRAVIDGAVGSPTLTVENLLSGRDRRLGYADAVASPASDPEFVVYAEAQLPRNRRARIARNSAFADFDYALYLGARPDPKNLLASSNGGDQPIRGRQDSVAVPFGNQKLLLVLAPRSELGGTLLLRLPWGLVVIGLFFTFAAAALVERLSRQREHAENLAHELEKIAAENARLLAAQRTVAYELQHSLLPETLPTVVGVDLAVRYIAGDEGVEIGGDWYDLLQLEDGHLLLVVGDVSGRGLRAATVMASLRYAIHAYVVQGDPPTVILTKLSKLLDVEGEDGGFATVLCAEIDVAAHQMTVASAGHLPPLVISEAGAELVPLRTGVPVGVKGGVSYESVTVTIPPRATLLVYTDGLVERRGESLDVGLDRLRDTARSVDGSLEHLLTTIVDRLAETGASDDTALLGVRWRT